MEAEASITSANEITPGRPGQMFQEVTSDRDLLLAVRAGYVEAYGKLYEKHRNVAIQTARRHLADRDLALDAVDEAFAGILAAIKAGGGPDKSFVAYLSVAVIREAWKRGRQQRLETPVDEHPEFNHPAHDLPREPLDSDLRDAFVSLPRRWQMALWYLDVEDRNPKDAAPLFDLTPNAMVALHRRAKKGLARAYIKAEEPRVNRHKFPREAANET